MNRINIVPKINKIEIWAQDVYSLGPDSLLCFSQECRRAGQLLTKITGLKQHNASDPGGSIRLEINQQVQQDEGYVLTIDAAGILIRAKSDRGLFYGVQSLRQLLPASIETTGIVAPVVLPYMRIEDAPRFAYRGFMLDEARHFFGMQAVKRVLDLLALQKLNKFHWHLSDHQGWRIEIKKYPKLTEIGSRRSKTQRNGLLALKAVYDHQEVSGFYTQAQIREIVQYAADNFIDVIPEIDLPGHSTAALAAYPELSCDGMAVEVGVDVGFASFYSLPKLVCAGKEASFTFLQNVLDELIELFPARTIHLGSDEAGKKVWQNCPDCQARIKEQGLKDENELQDYFINRLARHVFDQGCAVIGWNDGLFAHSDDRIIVQNWFHAYKETIQKIKAGQKAIMSPMASYYLNTPFRVSSLKQSYLYEPHVPELTEKEAHNILGVEAPYWTEFVNNRAKLEWGMFPRLLAISETAWTETKNKNYEDFESRLAVLEQRLDLLGVSHTSPLCYKKYRQFSNPLSIILSLMDDPDREFNTYFKSA